jgi:hypothetical protein
MRTGPDIVFMLWCRLTGQNSEEFNADELFSFYARPQVPELAITPYPQLLEAGITAARRGSLPLEHWLNCVRDLEPARSRSPHQPAGHARASMSGRVRS